MASCSLPSQSRLSGSVLPEIRPRLWLHAVSTEPPVGSTLDTDRVPSLYSFPPPVETS